MDKDHAAKYTPLVGKNIHLTWDEDYPVEAGTAYFLGSYKDFILSWQKDRWAHNTQLGKYSPSIEISAGTNSIS